MSLCRPCVRLLILAPLASSSLIRMRMTAPSCSGQSMAALRPRCVQWRGKRPLACGKLALQAAQVCACVRARTRACAFARPAMSSYKSEKALWCSGKRRTPRSTAFA